MFGWTIRRGLSLRLSLLLFLVAPLIMVLALSGYYTLQRLEEQVEKRLQEDIELIARAIRGPFPVLAVDAVRLEQALINLLRNAVQATGIRGKIRLGWFSVDGMVGFEVADDGPGIPEELRCRLFEPFFTTKAVGEGTGLGLAVAQAAAGDHDGRLEVGDSELGGARFTMIFKAPEGSHGGSP